VWLSTLSLLLVTSVAYTVLKCWGGPQTLEQKRGLPYKLCGHTQPYVDVCGKAAWSSCQVVATHNFTSRNHCLGSICRQVWNLFIHLFLSDCCQREDRKCC
jgi:hypothetical protein